MPTKQDMVDSENSAFIQPDSTKAQTDKLEQNIQEENQKKRMARSIFASMLVAGTLYLNIVSFYPTYAKSRYSLNTIQISIALTSFNLAGVVCAPLHSITISRMGRKNAIVIGFICTFLANTALGALSYINSATSADFIQDAQKAQKNQNIFFYSSCFSRFIQGYGDSLSMATSLSLISTNFPNQKELYISYIGASMGFGLMLGPPIGSFVYGGFGFAYVFYFFSVQIFIMLLLQIIFIPSKFNFEKKSITANKQSTKSIASSRKQSNHQSERTLSSIGSFSLARNAIHQIESKERTQSTIRISVQRSIVQSVAGKGVNQTLAEYDKNLDPDALLKGYNLLKIEDVGLWNVIKCKSVLFAFMANAMGMYNITFFSSFLAVRLQNHFHVRPSDIGFWFAVLSLSYLTSAILSPLIFSKLPRKLLFVIGFGVSTVALMMMGPSKLLHIPDDFQLVITGLFVLGFFQSIQFIFSLPEAIECYQNKYMIVSGVNPELDEKLNDVMSSGYGLFYNAMSLLGPNLGSTFYEYFGGDVNGYRNTLDINMILEFCIFIIFFTFNCGFHVFKNAAADKVIQEKLKQLEITIQELDERPPSISETQSSIPTKSFHQTGGKSPNASQFCETKLDAISEEGSLAERMTIDGDMKFQFQK